MKAITNQDRTFFDDLMTRCLSCSLAMVDKEGMPYVIPMNYAFDEDYLYFHSAPFGKKIDILKNNPAICVSFETDLQMRIQSEKMACSFSMRYRSLQLSGEIEFIDQDDIESKKRILDLFMQKYAPGKNEYTYSAPALKNVMAFRMKIENGLGKEYGYE